MHQNRDLLGILRRVERGTLDGANVEIREEVGPENFFLFGLSVAEIQELAGQGYRPGDYLDANPELREVLDLIGSGHFTRGIRRSCVPSSRT